MGVVDKARDTKLGRDVAIKVLSESLAREHGPVTRFQREAQLLARLNHTNIAGTHGVEEPKGQYALRHETGRRLDCRESTNRHATVGGGGGGREYEGWRPMWRRSDVY
jgi:serine/threonine protein kinase